MELAGRLGKPRCGHHLDRPVLRQTPVQRAAARRRLQRRLDLLRQGQHRLLFLAGRHRGGLLHLERRRRAAAGQAAQPRLDHFQLDEEAPHDGLEAERQPDALLDLLTTDSNEFLVL